MTFFTSERRPGGGLASLEGNRADIEYIKQSCEWTGRPCVKMVDQNLTMNDSGKGYVATGGLSRTKQGCSYAP